MKKRNAIETENRINEALCMICEEKNKGGNNSGEFNFFVKKKTLVSHDELETVQ